MIQQFRASGGLLIAAKLSFVFFLFCSSLVDAQELHTKILPVHHPGTGKRTIVIPYTNPFAHRLVIDSYSVFFCSRNVNFESHAVGPGKTMNIELEFEVPAAAHEDLSLAFEMTGHLDGEDFAEEPHSRKLGKFEFTVPVRDPVGLVRRHDFLLVADGKLTKTAVLNASATKWSKVVAKIAEEGVTTNCSITEEKIGSHVYQAVDISVNGLQRFISENVRPEAFTLSLYASYGDDAYLESVGSVTVPVHWHSAIEYFPKSVEVNSIKDELEINLVGRGIPIADRANELKLTIGSRELDPTQFKVTTLSRKSLRVGIKREHIVGDPQGGR